MINLHFYNARICQVAGGYLIVDEKILLVKHKKLGIWLAPGGHMEDGELLYQTAEREVFEESGIHVQVISACPLIDSDETEFLPIPFMSSLHWISEENYSSRLLSQNSQQPFISERWPRGCEQHMGNNYLVKPLSDCNLKFDPQESDDIGWFGLNDVDVLDTKDSVRDEITLAFKLKTLLNV